MDLLVVWKRILSVVLSVLSVLGIRFGGGEQPDPTAPCSAEAAIVFQNDDAGSAAGTVTVSAEPDGEYLLYWGDADGEKLTAAAREKEIPYTAFSSVTVSGGKGSADLNAFLAIPDGAQSVLIYNGADNYAGSLPLPDHKWADGGATYSFGALSDVHFNRYNVSGTGDDAEITFPAALDFLADFDVSMVAMSGDLSKSGEESAYQKFNRIASGYDFPVYTCKGNHDCYPQYRLENWQKYINPGVYGEDKKESVVTVADNGLDFVLCGAETGGDVFIFLSQTGGYYGLPILRILSDAQLDWLQTQLETYKDRRVFLFFHTFLLAESGNPLMGEGNLLTRSLSFYPLFYSFGAKDEKRFRSLMEEYKNVVFFNGHSHWAHDLQSINPNLNITDYNGETATMIHISSVSSPRISSNTTLLWTSDTMQRSEGYLVRVYDDYLVVTACDFLQNQMLAYATYIVRK